VATIGEHHLPALSFPELQLQGHMLRNAEVHRSRVGEGAHVQRRRVWLTGVEQLQVGVNQTYGCDLLET